MRRVVLITVLIFLFFPAMAQNWQDTVSIINNMFSRYLPNNPGGQLSISRNGKIIFSKAWGLADIENKNPYTTETVQEAGSITKQITAGAILLLEQQGKLSINDEVHKYLPELPQYGSPIKIENLLHHTSGLREWSSLEAITGWPRTTRVYRNDDVFKMICRQAKLNNIPGAEFIYSNSNYILLAIIVERVSGKSFPDFTTEYILKPAGMVHSSWRDSYRKVVPNRAIAYSRKGGRYEINMPFESVYGPGALITTSEDLLKWTHFYMSGKFGSPSLLQEQLHIEPLTGGGETIYAAGLFINKTSGLTKVFHDGQTASYTGIVETFPQIGLSIAWLSNTTEFKDSLLTGIHSLEKLFIKDTTKVVPEQIMKAAPVPVGIKNTYIGWYSDNRTDQGVKVTLVHDTLFFNETSLVPINQTDYRYKASIIKFESKSGLTLFTADKRKLFFSKKADAPATPGYLKAFVGKYYSKETESSFSLILKGSKLFFEDCYLNDVLLAPTYNNGFNFYFDIDGYLKPQAAYLTFKQNIKKAVIQCQVSTDDARGVNFIKIL
jgi:CubicO group peptidase (beta-lactamase class C family)